MRFLRKSTLAVACVVSLVMSGLVLGLGVGPAAAALTVVNCSAPGGSANLATALAGGSTTILVRGTCYGNFTIGRSLTLSSVPLLGPAILNGTGYSGAPVLTITAGNVVLAGLTVEDGSNSSSGGGISNDGNLTIVASTLWENSAIGSGGGISNDGGTVTVIGSTISGNTVMTGPGGAAGGGGIENDTGTVTVQNSTLSDNVANATGYGSFGGGIANSGTLTVSGSTFSDNEALNTGGGDAMGGAISNGQISGSTVNVTDSTFTDNVATGTYASYGGGIDNGSYPVGGTVTITASTLSGNEVVGTYYGPVSGGGADGGGLNNFGTVVISDSTVADNTATTNSAYNVGGTGGGVNNFGTMTVVHATLDDNNVNSGLYSVASLTGGSVITIVATIIAGGSGGSECGNGPVTDNGFNIDDDGSCGFTGTGSISHSATVDGTLGSLAENGGPTETIALLSGSPAINHVTLASDCTGNDQRGFRWPTPCDIGAVELVAGHPFHR